MSIFEWLEHEILEISDVGKCPVHFSKTRKKWCLKKSRFLSNSPDPKSHFRLSIKLFHVYGKIDLEKWITTNPIWDFFTETFDLLSAGQFENLVRRGGYGFYLFPKNGRYQDLGTKILVPRSWYQDLGTKILVPRSGTKILAQPGMARHGNIWHGTDHQGTARKYLARHGSTRSGHGTARDVPAVCH